MLRVYMTLYNVNTSNQCLGRVVYYYKC